MSTMFPDDGDCAEDKMSKVVNCLVIGALFSLAVLALLVWSAVKAIMA